MYRITVNTLGPAALHEFTVDTYSNGYHNSLTMRSWEDVDLVIHEFNPRHIIKVTYRRLPEKPDATHSG
jgi:hypothetical protein